MTEADLWSVGIGMIFALEGFALMVFGYCLLLITKEIIKFKKWKIEQSKGDLK